MTREARLLQLLLAGDAANILASFRAERALLLLTISVATHCCLSTGH